MIMLVKAQKCKFSQKYTQKHPQTKKNNKTTTINKHSYRQQRRLFDLLQHLLKRSGRIKGCSLVCQ